MINFLGKIAVNKFLFCLIFLFIPFVSQAEEIKLKNGNILQGEIISQQLGVLKVKTAMEKVATYYMFEIDSIGGKKSSMEDPFVPFVQPEQEDPSLQNKIHFQENELFSMTLPPDYQWLELPGQVMITDPLNNSILAMNFRPRKKEKVSQEEDDRILDQELDFQSKIVADQKHAYNFVAGRKVFGDVEAAHVDFLSKKRGQILYSSFTAFFYKEYFFLISAESPSLEQKNMLFKGLDTITFELTTLEQFLEKGKECFRLKQFDLAQRQFAKVLAIDPDHVEANYFTGQILFNLGTESLTHKELVEAEKYLLKALQLNPMHTKTLKALGMYYTKTNDFTQAVKYFEDFLEIIPQDPEAMLQLALNYDLMGYPQKSIPLLLKCLDQTPRNPDLYLYMAMSKVKMFQVEEALKYLREGKTLVDRVTDEARYQKFFHLEKQLDKEWEKTHHGGGSQKEGLNLIFYILILSFFLMFIKGFLIIKQSLDEKMREF